MQPLPLPTISPFRPAKSSVFGDLDQLGFPRSVRTFPMQCRASCPCAESLPARHDPGPDVAFPRRGFALQDEQRSPGSILRAAKRMTFYLCGYFPKKVTPRPEGYDLPGVVDIASVCDCIAKGPEDWIKSWTFNELGFFDDVALAEAVVPESERSQFQVYAYEFLDERFAGGLAEPWTVPPLSCKLPGSEFELLGFDVVSKSITDFFEHSPLSCNGAAKTFMANPHCLFDALGDAVAAAKVFSNGDWEPGPYYVARVLRRRVLTT
jgi:hypothetical protein